MYDGNHVFHMNSVQASARLKNDYIDEFVCWQAGRHPR